MSGRRSKRYVKSNRGWADLPEDILLLIKGKLKIVDQMSFRAVCRNWGLVSCLKSADKLPWILVFCQVGESDESALIADILYDPSNGQEYSLDHQLVMLDDSICRNECYSKFGWVLLSLSLYTEDIIFSLYHVFTRKTIDLPALNAEYCGKGIFSTTPTSSDCVFCVAQDDWYGHDDLIISIYRYGDEAWSTFIFETTERLPSLEDLFYRKGQFYFVMVGGLLWAFDVASHDWQQLATDTSQIMNVQSILEPKRERCYETKVIESNGEILMVYFRRNWKPWYIFKLDWSLMAWVKETTLGNRALFLGKTSLSVPTGGEIKSFAGRINFQNESKKFNHYNFKNIARHQSSRLSPLVNKYYSNFNKVEQDRNWVWVEPHS